MEIRMAETTREITLGNDLGEIVVKANGASIQIHANGSLDTFTDESVRTHPAGGKTASAPKPGDKMPDGSVYAGVSPDSGEAMYVTPADAPLLMTFDKAAKYAAGLDAYGHKDWRLPTEAELLEIYKNRNEGALNGTFNQRSGSGLAHWYWSCTEVRGNPSFVYVVVFTDGDDDCDLKDDFSLSSRPLRTEPRP
jgi:Protein of unknown function (DUF1566)